MRIERLFLVLVGLMVAAGALWLLLGGAEPPEPIGDDGSRGRSEDDGGRGRLPAPPRITADVRGVVLGPDGRPRPDARVRLWAETEPTVEPAPEAVPPRVLEVLAYAAEEDGRPLRILNAGAAAPAAPFAEQASGPEGVFRFPVTIGRRYRVSADADDLLSGRSEAVRAGDHVVLRLSRGTQLRGTVFGGASPVAGATVSVDGGPATRTEKDGTFRLGELAPGPLTVRLAREGYASALVTLDLPPGGLEREFRLEPGLTVSVLVEIWEDEGDDTPAAGATVALLHLPSGEMHQATTDAEGRAKIGHLAPGRYDATAWLDGTNPDMDWDVLLTADRSLEFSLEKAVLSTIRVLGPDGRPVPEARFLLANADDEIDVRVSREVGRADENGIFRFAFDDERRAMLWVTAPGLAAGLIEPDDPAEPEEITVILRRGATLEGIVLDDERRPVAGAILYVESYHDDVDDEVIVTVVSGDDGRFRVDNLIAGEVDIEVSAEGFLETDEEIEDLAVNASPIEIVLERGLALTGRVVDGAGNGVEGVAVAAPGTSGETATTGAEGAFRLDAIEPRAARTDIRLILRRGSLSWPATTRIDRETTIVMPDTIALKGRVVSGGERRPVPTFRIDLRVPGGGALGRREITDPEGAFEIVAPRLSGVELRIQARAHASWSRLVGEISEAEREALEVVLERPPSVTVRVTGPTGDPVLGARVLVRGTRESWTTAGVTNSTGQALVRARPGEAVIVAAHRSYTGAVSPSVLLGGGEETTQELRLGPACAARIRVEGSGGSRIESRLRFGAQTIRTADGERAVLTARGAPKPLRIEVEGVGVAVLRYVRPRVEGDALVLRGLPEGSYRARAVSGANQSAFVSFTISAGSTVEVPLALGR